MNSLSRRPTYAAITVAIVLAMLASACSHIFRKNYFLLDESPAVIIYEGYNVQMQVQSRLAGYAGAEDFFYLAFDVSYPGPDTLGEGINPIDYFRLDSVCVVPFKKDTTICVHLLDEHEILDNYYNREAFLTRFQFDGVHLSNSNQFIWVSYTVTVMDPRTGKVTASKRFEQELERFVYRTY